MIGLIYLKLVINPFSLYILHNVLSNVFSIRSYCSQNIKSFFLLNATFSNIKSPSVSQKLYFLELCPGK